LINHAVESFERHVNQFRRAPDAGHVNEYVRCSGFNNCVSDGRDHYFAIGYVDLVTRHNLFRRTPSRLDLVQRGVGRVAIKSHDVGAEASQHLARE
jgi:hypothetical protein